MTSCARTADVDFIERYVLGQMDEAEQASFEEHYFECPDCLAAVQALQAAQTVLREGPPKAETSGRVVEFNAAAVRAKTGEGGAFTPHMQRSGRGRMMSGAAWIGLAAAASLVGVLVWAPWRAAPQPATTIAKGPDNPTLQPPPAPAPGPHPENPQFGTPPAGATTQPSGTGGPGASATAGATKTPANPGLTRPAISLDVLALVVPPPYVALTTRGNENPQGEAFAAAMTKYAAKDYRGAVDGLKPIVESQPDALPAQFFLGISYLALNEPASASAVLNRVASSNVAPFADEAHFYLAKAALGAHDLDRAERELSLAIERQAGPPNEATKLQQSIRIYRREHNQD